MGLFWSMQSGKKVEYRLSQKLAEVPIMKSMKVIFTVEMENKPVASCECKRLFLNEDIKVSDITSNGLVARFFNIPDTKPKPGVIILGGSDGSIYNSQKIAGVLASHGYAALALAYYGMETLPGSLENLPVEYVEKAVQWMKSNPEIDGRYLTVFGKSKGAELAILSASHIRDIHGVIAWIPSPIAFEGLNVKGRSGGVGSWSYQNQPVPFVRFKVNPLTFGMKCCINMLLKKKITIRTEELYIRAIQNQEEVAKAFFRVENIQGSILLVSSTFDNIWPSKKFSEMAMDRLKILNFPYQYQHLNYRAGHFVFIPHEPITRCDAPPEDVAFADRDSWEKILLFLEENCQEGL
jgi:hypothetical protein